MQYEMFVFISNANIRSGTDTVDGWRLWASKQCMELVGIGLVLFDRVDFGQSRDGATPFTVIQYIFIVDG